MMFSSRCLTFWLWVVLMLIGYNLPWIVNPGNGLTLNGYDLAEWVSLHPVVRAQPLLYTSLLLRLPLALVTLLIALHAPKPRFGTQWMFHAAACFLLVAAQLPPLDFITRPNDPNYQQQFILAVGGFLGSLIGLSGLVAQYRLGFRLASGTAAIIAISMGYEQAAGFMRGFHLPAVIGAGFVGIMLLFTILLIQTLIERLRRNKAAQVPPR